MDFSNISPKYMIGLINKVEEAIWGLFDKSKYQGVRRYILRWWNEGEKDWYGNVYNENFTIYYKEGNIDLAETLHRMPNEMIVRIATDLGVDTPGFLPVVPKKFKNILRDQNQSAYQNFERAIKNVYSNPDESVALASATLDGIIRTILKHETFKDKNVGKNGISLTKQVKSIVKQFTSISGVNCPTEIITIASQLKSIGSSIDTLRSDKTIAHGKINGEYIVDDPLWASFIVNTAASLGLFLWEFFNKKYKLAIQKEDEPRTSSNNNMPTNLDEIPF